MQRNLLHLTIFHPKALHHLLSDLRLNLLADNLKALLDDAGDGLNEGVFLYHSYQHILNLPLEIFKSILKLEELLDDQVLLLDLLNDL